MATPDRPPNLRLWSELVGLYLALPFTAWQLRASGVQVPVIPLLLGVGPLAWWAIRQNWTPYDDLLVAGRTPRKEWRRIAWIFALGALGITVYTRLYEPAHLFELPRERPWVWLAILVGYPLLSVYPQELIFRGCFFLRYGHLFPSTWSRVGASALAFGFAHLLFGNAVAVLLSTLGGLLFGWTWLRSRSLAVSAVEHALYGCFLFTVGLGRYFYAGPH